MIAIPLALAGLVDLARGLASHEIPTCLVAEPALCPDEGSNFCEDTYGTAQCELELDVNTGLPVVPRNFLCKQDTESRSTKDDYDEIRPANPLELGYVLQTPVGDPIFCQEERPCARDCELRYGHIVCVTNWDPVTNIKSKWEGVGDSLAIVVGDLDCEGLPLVP